MTKTYIKIFIAYIAIIAGVHILFTQLNWPGGVSSLWVLPMVFALVVFFRSMYELIKKRYKVSLQFLCLSLLALFQGLKTPFYYYNLFFHVLLLVAILYFYYKTKKSADPKFMARQKYLLLPFVCINLVVLLVPDAWVYKYVNSNKKVWSADKPIEWSDFRAVPDSNSEYVTSVKSDIMYKISEVYNYPQVVASAVMDRDESWTKTTLYAGLLKHEQLHFSIAEVYARKYATINNYWPLNPVVIEDSLTKIFDEYYAVDSIYDSETDHSLNFPEQLEWDKKIEKLLNE